MGGLADGAKGPEVTSGDRLALLWRRVKEHRIAQWTVGYVAVAYGIQHAVTLTSEAYEWPNIVARLSMTLLALGLPLAMTVAWYHGERVNRRVSGGEAAIVSLLLVLISLVFYVFVRPVEQSATAPAQEATVTAARSAAATPKGAISVAVLPFLNLSSDKEQEFFSDGMTEEITAALAKVPDLRVVARTSAFEFKGKNVNIKTMGEELGATHLIEGSVRKSGNRLRITAQLIKADDGTHIWAEDYDRELTDVFAIQEDIARAITASLHMTLGLKPGENLVNNRSIDPDSYEKFLRAVGLGNARGAEPTGTAPEIKNITEAIALFQDVLAKNPRYAPAWGFYSGANFVLANNSQAGDPAAARAKINDLRAIGEAAARKAVELDTNSALGPVMLGWWARSRGSLVEAEALLKKALALDPADHGILFNNAMFSASAGRLKDALGFAEKGHGLDPLHPNLGREMAEELWLNGQADAAIALAKTLRPNPGATVLAYYYASLGHYDDAADMLMKLAAGNTSSPEAQTARLLRRYRGKPVPAGELPKLRAGLAPIYVYLGAPERALEGYQLSADTGFLFGGRGYIWHPDFAPVRKTERFKTLMKQLGFAEYWRAKGWPDLCHPTTGDDFECS